MAKPSVALAYLSLTKEQKLKATKQELFSIFKSNLLGKKSILRSQCVVIIMKKVKGKHRWRSRSAKRIHLSSELRTPNSELRTQVSLAKGRQFHEKISKFTFLICPHSQL